MISRKKYRITIAILLFAVVFSFFLGRLSFFPGSKLLQIQHILDNDFALTYNTENAVDAAAHAYADSLSDPYTVYLSEDEYRYFNESLSLTYNGLGITLDYNGDEAVVSEVISDSAAAAAGIMAGDVLLSVDEYTLSRDNYDEAVAYIRGYAENSVSDEVKMHFTFRRENEAFELDIKRAAFSVPSVSYEMLDNGIFYISLSTFSDEAADEFCDALKNSAAANAIIMDLRDNSGGLISALLKVCDELMPEGKIFSSVDAKGKLQEYKTSDNDYISLPLVVLVNENSASASEIFAAAVKQSGRGTLVGTTTYGKGLVQSLYTFNDGSALKYTSAKYYTYDGSYINDIGVEPDIEAYDAASQLEEALGCLSEIH